MRESAYNLHLLKMVFLDGPWLKISAVYCFAGFFIACAGGRIYMEEAVEEGLASYSLAVSLLPAVMLLYYPVLRICQSSSAVVSQGKEQYIGRLRNLLWLISGAFVLYYGAGTYLMSKFIFSEGHWYDSEANLKIWGLKLLLLFLLLMTVSLVLCFCMVRNVNFGAAAFFTLIAVYLFWRRIDLNGFSMRDISVLIAVLLVLLLIEEYLLKRWDFMYWR